MGQSYDDISREKELCRAILFALLHNRRAWGGYAFLVVNDLNSKMMGKAVHLSTAGRKILNKFETNIA